MAKPRKTIEVSHLLETINKFLASDTYHGQDGRQVAINILSSALSETENYHGFRYLFDGEVPEGHKPGINTVEYVDYEHPQFQEFHRLRFKDTDPTRINFYSN